MYQQIKQMAEEALKLQNKNFMDETLKNISAACDAALIQDDASAQGFADATPLCGAKVANAGAKKGGAK